MVKFLSPLLVILTFLTGICATAHAHFGMLIPSESMVMKKKDAKVRFDIAFSHPFAQTGMNMEKPKAFFVQANGQQTNLTDTLKPAKFLGLASYESEYEIREPGVYRFGLVPEPYYEPAEEKYIIHYTKTVIGAFGDEEGWDEPLDLPVEIIPLARPFGNYAGNTFTGRVVKDGKPLSGCVVEVEFFNAKKRLQAPNEYFETQTVLTDDNGVFTFGIPWAGWWGFSALTESGEKIDYKGSPKGVELGGVLWLNFAARPEN